MAIIWMDGFDHYGVGSVGRDHMRNGAYAEANLSVAQNVGPGGSGNAVQLSVDGGLRKVLPGARSAVGIGERIYCVSGLPGVNYAMKIMEFRDSANLRLFTVYVQSTGSIVITANEANPPIAQTDPVIVPQSWQHVEVFIKFSAGSGEIRINVNGLPVYDADGLNTTSASVSQVFWGNQTGTTNYYMRDLYIWDTTGDDNNSGMQGDRQVITTFPVEDGANQDWTPSTGVTGWNILAQNPPNDTTWVEALLDGDLSDYVMGDIDTDITSISAVRLAARMKKSDAGIGTVKLGVSVSTDIAEGAETAISTEFIYYSAIFEKDPHTDGRWSPTGVNNALARLNRIQ